MKSMAERIADKETELRKMKERHQRAEAKRKRDEADQAKKNAERRAVLVGAVILAKVERGEISESQLQEWLQGELTRSEDRALFGL